MFSKRMAKWYCCEDISLVENYEQAKRDLIEVWDIHHRKEDDGYSREELIEKGMYYHRPANELIFLKSKEHISLHNRGNKHPFYGKHLSEEHRGKISLNHADFSGERNPNYGKHRSEETKKKTSEAQKGEKNHMYGKHHSEETRRKMSEAQKGEKSHMYGKTGEKHPSSKPVNQIDKKTGQVIKTWACTAEVQRVLGINQGSISKCCLGKLKSAGGYFWKYAG